MSWSETTLGPHVDLISGPAFKSRNFTDDPSDVPLVKGENIGQGIILWDKSKYWPRADSEGYQRFFLLPGDVILAMDRPWVSAGLKYAVINERDPEALLVQRVARMRGVSGLSSQYLRYIIASPAFCAYAKNIMGGTNVPHMSGDQIRAFPFSLPQKADQQRISSILSAYDDLIGNNRRRIQLLEEAARLLYKEWFVHLRFPGHERVSITDGVPEGWEKKKIEDVCKTVGGGTPSTKVSEYWGGDITWVIPSDITKNDCLALLDSERKITEKGLRESSAKMVPAETILMTSRASVGFFALMDREVCTNQGLINIIPHEDELRMYLMFNLMSRVTEIRSNAKGTTYPEISKGRFRGMDIVVPSKTLVNEFSRVATVITQQVRCLKRSTLHLEAARDLFLPRLMNGKLSV